jgi:LuxR family maltose regulon positive regulatory protein
VTIWGTPRLPVESLDRTRLEERFDGDAPLVVLHALGGSGKTVLLAQWASRTRSCGVWVSVLDPDTETTTLVQLLADALIDAGLVPAGSPLRDAAAAMGGGTEPIGLLRRGLQQLASETVIVIDQADNLVDDVCVEIIALVAANPRLRVFCAARRSTPFSDPAAALDVDIEIIDTDALALRTEETAELLGVPVEDDAVDIVRRSGGLAIVARAFLVERRRSKATPRLEGAVDLVASHLRRLRSSNKWDADFFRFLTLTAEADVLDVELAARLSGQASAEDQLGRAEAEGLGLWIDEPTTRTFSYSPLIREALERELRSDNTVDRAILQRVVARWSFEHDRPWAALKRSVEIDDWEFANTVVRRTWYLLLKGHSTQMQRLFARAPIVKIRHYPLIAMMIALNYNAKKMHRLRALEFFGLALSTARLQGNKAPAADRALLRTVESAALRVMGQFGPALAAAEDAYLLLTTMGLEQRAALGNLEPTLYNQVGTTFFYNGRNEQALASFRASEAVGEAQGLLAGMGGMALASGTLAASGEIDQARVAVEQARAATWPADWMQGYMGSFYQLAEAFIALEEFDADRAEKHLRTLDPHRDTIEHWPLLAHVEAMIAFLRGRPGDGLLALEATIAIHEARRSLGEFTQARLRSTRALLELADDDAVGAERTLRQGRSVERRDAVGLARIALSQGDPNLTLRLLEARRATPGSARVQAETGLLHSAALIGVGETAAGLDAFEKTVRLMRDRQQRFALALLPVSSLDQLYARVRASGREELVSFIDEQTVPRLLTDQPLVPRLTGREKVVARQLLETGSAAVIATTLTVSTNTVKAQLRSLYRKLGARTRDEAIAKLSTIDLEP